MKTRLDPSYFLREGLYQAYLDVLEQALGHCASPVPKMTSMFWMTC